MSVKATPAAEIAGDHFDVVVVGSGFGSAFFVHELLRSARPRRILIVEWGDHHPHDWQVDQKRNSAILDDDTFVSASEKPWNFTIGLGGGTNCWFAQTPRFHPNDFKLKSRYGIGADWPIDYAALEPFYCDAEEIMAVSGDPDMARIMPRSRPFPQPPHRMSTPDARLKAARPDQHFTMPTARARIATDQRNACCASFRCQICPADAKFTANNGLQHVFADERVTLCLKTRAVGFETQAGTLRSLIVEADGKKHTVHGDMFVLGANAIHSPAILEASGMGGGMTGKGLHESYGVHVEALLKGMDNFDGSTITTGLDYGLYDGDFRRTHSAALVYFDNRWTHGFRREPGRWRETLPMMIVLEDLLSDDNAVTASPGSPIPTVTHKGESAYTKAGLERAMAGLPDMLSTLPVEDIVFRSVRPTESHLQGTLRMGDDAATSVIDSGQIHHRWRNLVVVGSSVFPTCSCANPSLTVAALSLRAARQLA